jgi:hypothetical protein
VEQVEQTLHSEEWFVGIGTDVAVKVGNKIELGRITRITRKSAGKKKKAADYRKRVCLSSGSLRTQLHNDGVRFICHWFDRPKHGEDAAVYTFKGESPFEVDDLGPHAIVSPVILEYEGHAKWRLDAQSLKIVQTQKRGNTDIAVTTIANAAGGNDDN